jgi:hypothetical protein
MDVPKFTFADFEACARRELKYRIRVYPRLVDEGRMNEARAQREIELMASIADYFESMSQGRLL